MVARLDSEVGLLCVSLRDQRCKEFTYRFFSRPIIALFIPPGEFACQHEKTLHNRVLRKEKVLSQVRIKR